MLVDVFADDREWGAAAGTGEVRRRPQVPAPQVSGQMPVELLSQVTGRYAFEAVDQPGQGGRRRIVHEEVDVVVLAVELAEFGAEVGAHICHDLLAAREDRIGECPTPVLRGEDQMCVQVADDAPAASHIGIRGPSG